MDCITPGSPVSKSPGVYSNPCPLSGWCCLTTSSSTTLFAFASVFPSIWVFFNESALRIRWPKYWSFSFHISLNAYLNLRWRCFMTEATAFYVSNISAYTTQRPPKLSWTGVCLDAGRKGLGPAVVVLASLLWLCCVVTCTLKIIIKAWICMRSQIHESLTWQIITYVISDSLTPCIKR